MPPDPDVTRIRPIAATLLGVLAVGLIHAWQIPYSFSMSDEGFLWYGVQRVMQGEVPLRDFMAYDPARYYSAARLMGLAGDDGLLALRVAMLAFQAASVAIGLAVLAGVGGRREAVFAALLLGVWMVPYYKVHDQLAALLLLLALADLVRAPTAAACLRTGVAIGVAALIGRNHAAYGVFGATLAAAWLAMTPPGRVAIRRGWAPGLAGLVLGISPLLAMCALVPGFAVAFADSVRFLFEFGATNIARPVPWPWQLRGRFVAHVTLPLLGTGITLLAIAAFVPASIVWVGLQRLRRRAVPPALVSAACLALPYAHYAFSRPDTVHAVLGVLPLLIGTLTILAACRPVRRWLLAGGMAVLSLCATGPLHQAWQCERNPACAQVEIAGSQFTVLPATRDEIALLRHLATAYAPGRTPFIAVPFWPGAHALLGRRSALWEIYPLVDRAERTQIAEVARLRETKPGFAIIARFGVDWRMDTRFEVTHAPIYRYITEHFERRDDPTFPDLEIYRARD